jgi:hypothetical protein
MVLFETADSAASVAAAIVDRTPKTLSGTAKRLYTALVAAAIDTGKGRGYSPGTTHITMHLPLEVLASVCGIHRVTAWRNLKPLRELGLIDYTSHKGTLRGETRNTGTLFEVRMNPSAGTKAKLSYHDKKHKWRDLDKDVKRKRTAHRQLKDRMQQSIISTSIEVDISRLLEWTLPPKPTKTPLASDCCKVSLEAILDVRHAKKEERNQMVELAAVALAQSFNDAKSTGWYQKLLWQLLRRFDATGEDFSYQVYLMAQRARTDSIEGFARKPGALFVSRLKRADFYDWVMNAPPRRVGTQPN